MRLEYSGPINGVYTEHVIGRTYRWPAGGLGTLPWFLIWEHDQWKLTQWCPE